MCTEAGTVLGDFFTVARALFVHWVIKHIIFLLFMTVNKIRIEEITGSIILLTFEEKESWITKCEWWQ